MKPGKSPSFLFALLLFFTLKHHHAKAQYVSLQNNELARLKQLLQSDSDAKKLFKKYEDLANASLSAAPAPVETVVSEGHLATDPAKIITIKALADIDKMYALALLYRVSNNKDYLNGAAAFLTAWARTNLPNGNPINDTKFENAIAAYDLIKTALPENDNKVIRQWLVKMADNEIGNKRFYSGKKSVFNNWNSHRLKVIGLIGYALDVPAYKTFVDTAIQRQIANNLYADGSGYDFEERDALHYHVYTLEPLIELAIVIKRATGKDYYNYVSAGNSSIKKSVDFLKPFATGEKTHGEFVHSNVAFDKARANNKEAGFTIGAPFQPEHAANVLSEAAWFEPACMNIVRQLKKTTARYPNWQAVLNGVQERSASR